MTRSIMRLVAMTAVGLSAMWSCHTTDGDVNLPQKATDFIYRYFPSSYVSSKEEPTVGVYVVKMTKGPTLTFDNEGSWTDLQGNGETLPEIIAFDYFPTPLYDYIESKEELKGIYAVTRNAFRYDVMLFATRLNYDIRTEKVTEINP